MVMKSKLNKFWSGLGIAEIIQRVSEHQCGILPLMSHDLDHNRHLWSSTVCTMAKFDWNTSSNSTSLQLKKMLIKCLNCESNKQNLETNQNTLNSDHQWTIMNVFEIGESTWIWMKASRALIASIAYERKIYFYLQNCFFRILSDWMWREDTWCVFSRSRVINCSVTMGLTTRGKVLLSLPFLFSILVNGQCSSFFRSLRAWQQPLGQRKSFRKYENSNQDHFHL